MIWNKIADRMIEKTIFKNQPKQEIYETYQKISFILTREGVALPKFWARKFSPLECETF